MKFYLSKLNTFCVILSVIFAGQNFGQSANVYQVPLTEYGHPDLQGLWTDQSRTPIERPASLGLKRTYSLQEIKELEQSLQAANERAQQPLAANRGAPPLGEAITQQPDINFNGLVLSYIPVNGEYLTSRIVEPANGRLPYIDDVPQDIFARRISEGMDIFDGPEMRPSNERCLGVPGQLPLLVQLPLYGPWRNIQIVQNEDYVMIYGEYHVTPRVVRLNDQHPDNTYPKFYGDSIGYWEGNTLVVHTNSFKPDQSDRRLKSSDVLEVIERYTPVSNTEMILEFQITDKKIYSEPITSRLTIQRMPPGHKLYESGCHEGNYSLPSILAGARRQEADARLAQ
tara:strand:- start:1898 stop:2920 length:1023 start_codon:yes stop_codon:yes gene_type:complete